MDPRGRGGAERVSLPERVYSHYSGEAIKEGFPEEVMSEIRPKGQVVVSQGIPVERIYPCRGNYQSKVPEAGESREGAGKENQLLVMRCKDLGKER